MRLTTWNVNGIRNPFSYPPWNTARTFPAMFDILGSDIVVMQELKIQRKDLRDDMVLIDGWDAYFSLPKQKKGYSGVGIYTRNSTCAPIKAEEGLLGVLPSFSGVPYCELPEDQSIGGYPSLQQIAELHVDPTLLDAEGRCMILEFPAFVLFGIYSPANSNGMRDDFRYAFIRALDYRIRNLIAIGKNVIVVGDLNVSRNEMDTASAMEDCRKSGITHDDYISTPNRRIFNQLIIGGEVVGERDDGREDAVLFDTTRDFHPDRKGMYTHWEQKINARPGNYGSRIDYVLVSRQLRPWIKDANIQEGLLGSDHCPVFVEFQDTVRLDESEVALSDVMNPQGVYENGERKQDWKVSTVPAFSAKRMPEFDKRRSIKSMFAAPAPKKQQFDFENEREKLLAAQTNQDSAQRSDQSPSKKTIVANAMVSPLKRTGTESKDKSNKRQKAANRTFDGKGQQSLKGFFTSSDKQSPESILELSPVKAVDQTISSSNANYSEISSSADIVSVSPITARRDRSREDEDNIGSAPLHCPGSPLHLDTESTSQTPLKKDPASPRSSSPTPSPNNVSARLAAAETSQRSWGALFSRPVAPLCESHNEPCKTMLTKKKGSNQGRSFWMCARPLGPSGDKERGTQWRCPTFIWCSDWSGKREGGGEG